MAFTILNEADAGVLDQAEIDSVDLGVIVAAFNGNCVIAGLATTAQGTPNMTVAVAAGLAMIAGKAYNYAGGNGTITTADATNPRYDLISISNAGALVVTAGSPNASPVFPAIPANNVVIAVVRVAAGATTIVTANITDKRMIDAFRRITIYKSADESVTSSTTFQDDDDLKVAVDINSVWVVDWVILATGTNGDIKIQFTVPSGTTLSWGPIAHSTTTNPSTSLTPYWLTVGTAAAMTVPLIETGTLALGLATGTDVSSLIWIRMIIKAGGTAGNVVLQWAQNASNGTATKVQKGSHVFANRLGP